MLTADPKEVGLAKLLGLSIKEYKELKHSPLMDIKNHNGVIIEYFIHVSPQNRPELLEKVGIKDSNFLRFSVKEIAKLLKKEK